MEKYYQVYGMVIKSEVECTELFDIEENFVQPDILIRYSSLNQSIHEKIEEGQCSSYMNESIWFHIHGVATFLIEEGKRITVELGENADHTMVKQYLLGSCLGIIMLQRNMIAIHGGTIVLNNKGVIFTGTCGAGKSTITSALRLRGYGFLTDDVSSIEMKASPMINPGFPQQKLCEDAMLHFGYEEKIFNCVMGDTKVKYLVPVANSFVNAQVPLHAIVEIVASDEVEDVKFEQLYGIEKLMAIYQNIYRIELKQFVGMNPEYFKKCVEIAKSISVYRIFRPKGVMTVEAQIKWLEEIMFEYEEREALV